MDANDFLGNVEAVIVFGFSGLASLFWLYKATTFIGVMVSTIIGMVSLYLVCSSCLDIAKWFFQKK